MTAMALFCIAEANKGLEKVKNLPKNCDTSRPGLEKLEYFLNNDLSNQNYPAELEKFKQLVRTIRWPDDPTRFIEDKKSTVGKFIGLTKGGECEDRKNTSSGKKRSLSIHYDGLFCNSHYGKLQFLHSMDNGMKVGGSRLKQTSELIDQWMHFAFEVATSEETDFSNQPYCKFWNGNNTYPKLAEIMYEESLERKLCRDRHNFWSRFGLKSKTKAWRVSTTFSMKCKNPVSSTNCTEFFGDEPLIKMSALGSILHLIQDSYSTSHTDRGVQKLGEPTIILNAVTEFHDYSAQEKQEPGLHQKSDLWPNETVGKDTLDPITASAQLVWLAVTKNTTKISINQIKKGVFGF